MTDVALLEREMYAEAEAARLLDVAHSTLHSWLEGKTGRGGKVHRPVIRVKPKGARAAVTWAEFVEAGVLGRYRRELEVPLPELRALIDLLRERSDVPYPLADRRLYASGKALVPQAGGGRSSRRALARDDGRRAAAAHASVGVVPATRPLEGELATGWRPHEDPDSVVLIDPAVRFGRPAVGGSARR